MRVDILLYELYLIHIHICIIKRKRKRKEKEDNKCHIEAYILHSFGALSLSLSHVFAMYFLGLFSLSKVTVNLVFNDFSSNVMSQNLKLNKELVLK